MNRTIGHPCDLCETLHTSRAEAIECCSDRVEVLADP